MLAQLEARIKTSAERELLARNLIRKELVEKASQGDTDGVKQLLEMVIFPYKLYLYSYAVCMVNCVYVLLHGKVAAECQSSKDGKTRPRATVEVRNDSGQSLLSIAAQNDDVELAQVRV